MQRRFHPGDIVKHFKRERTVFGPGVDVNAYMYEIIGYAQHTETREELMIYRALYGDKLIYARPVAMFESKVDREKYPKVEQEYRFEVMTLEELEEVSKLRRLLSTEK